MNRNDFLNHTFWISVGGEGGQGRGTVRRKKTTVAKLREQLSQPSIDASLTFEEFQGLTKVERDNRKAQPGFLIAGRFRDGKRRITHQLGRSCVQLDIDHAKPSQVEAIIAGDAEIRQFCFLAHTTRSHSPENPRYRLLVFLNREVNADESNALSRLLALKLAKDPDKAIEIPDPASFRYNQMMYLPSMSRDQEFKCYLNEASILDVDEFLLDFLDWKDLTALPRQKKESENRIVAGLTRMESPREKDGFIGAWNRAWPISEAISEFLSDLYEPAEGTSQNRYSYVPGTSSNGVVIYDDDAILFSHHASDPIQGAVNCFDLVRIHKFGELDDDVHGNVKATNLPSFEAMVAFAEQDPRVRAELFAFMSEAFDDLDDEDLASSPETRNDIETNGTVLEANKSATDKSSWQDDLELDKWGGVRRTRHNAMTIITRDPRIAPFIGKNELTGAPAALGRFRFPKVKFSQPPFDGSSRRWTDTDDAALAWILAAPASQNSYGLTFQKQELHYALLQTAEQNSFNPALERIHETPWDGVKRIETVFIDWLGAADNAYHRELATVWFAAAIARLHEPGHEFHLVPILGGRQGGGKTGFIKALGMEFYGELSGEFSNLQKMVESTRGKWILEVPELKGFRKSELGDLKQYFTATYDTIRLPYRANPEDFKRRCVYMGTTNEDEYLRDDENRRFCPVITDKHRDNILDFAGFLPIVPQLWAEAEQVYLEMRTKLPKGMLALDLTSPDAKTEARRLQDESREIQPHETVAQVIQEWLDTPVDSYIATEGSDLGLYPDPGEKMFLRNLVSATMVRRALEYDPVVRDLRNSSDRVIGQALRSLDGWRRVGNVQRLGVKARFYAREGTDDTLAFIPAETANSEQQEEDIYDGLLD